MFLPPYRVAKDSKDHTCWSLVETVRTTDGPRQHTICYLRGFDSSGQARWLKAVEVSNHRVERPQLKLFPSDVEPPANDPEVVQGWVKKIRLEQARRSENSFQGLDLWKRLELDGLRENLLDAEPTACKPAPVGLVVNSSAWRGPPCRQRLSHLKDRADKGTLSPPVFQDWPGDLPIRSIA